jgi:hypothetical protein
LKIPLAAPFAVRRKYVDANDPTEAKSIVLARRSVSAATPERLDHIPKCVIECGHRPALYAKRENVAGNRRCQARAGLAKESLRRLSITVFLSTSMPFIK